MGAIQYDRGLLCVFTLGAKLGNKENAIPLMGANLNSHRCNRWIKETF